jgi:hypothetical protein
MTHLEKLSFLVSEHGAVLDYTVAAGCRCLGCCVYEIQIEERKFQEDTLAECIDAAYNLISQPPQ